MNSESDFQRQLDRDVTNWQLRLVYADWLDEHRDPLAAGYRALGRLRRWPSSNGYNNGWMYPFNYDNVWIGCRRYATAYVRANKVYARQNKRGTLNLYRQGNDVLPGSWTVAAAKIVSPGRRRRYDGVTLEADDRVVLENAAARAFSHLQVTLRDRFLATETHIE